MMAHSHPALAGAFGGALIGIAQYVLAMGVMRRLIAREVEEGGDMPGMAFVTQRFVKFRRILAAFSFVFLPALGFALGAFLSAGSESSS